MKLGLCFVAPWLIGLALFQIYPIAASFWFSLCDYSVLQPAHFIGLGNYHDLAGDDVFWLALRNTLGYAAIALPLGLVTALATAILLNSGVRGMAFYRTFFFLPSLVPAVASAILWLWLLNGEYGVLNVLLGKAGVKGPGWLSDPLWTKPALVLMSLWGVGNTMVIFLAGLQDVPQQLYEAADLDGAGWLGKLRHVTLPMVSPVILFNLIMGIIGSLQMFAVPYIMLPGGQPARSGYFYTEYLYDNALPYLQMGYASAMAWILFLITLACTFAALRLSQRHVHYEGA
ncbi:MAG: sugar ABC transporter permease [Armatimonadetes bacterium]|nr:sugar ABC transporter permease [Armatimonadota bacterium]